MLDKLQQINRKFGNRPLTQKSVEIAHDQQTYKSTHDYSSTDLSRLALRHGIMSSPNNPYAAYNTTVARSKSNEDDASRKTYETHESSVGIGIGIAPHYTLLRSEPEMIQS